MSSPDEGSEQTVAAGTSRTPPPRTRRGAPVSRPSATATPLAATDDHDETDSIWSSTRSSAEKASTGSTGASTTAKSGASSTKNFDWDTAGNGDPGAAAKTAAATAAVEAAVAPAEPAAAPLISRSEAKARAKVVKRPERRFRQTIVKVDLWSVTKMALCFYVSAMAVAMVALVALWVVADSAGIITSVEKFIGNLFSSKDFHFVSAQVLRGAVLVAVALVALLVVFTIVAASFYNIFAELFGGVEVVIREEEHPPKR